MGTEANLGQNTVSGMDGADGCVAMPMSVIPLKCALGDG